ncbi:hypothetical protein PM082_009182 [Marasmius tenuissimus]|nr:hypothetical protein PM082_009182 [Marasmius tenuissimus]
MTPGRRLGSNNGDNRPNSPSNASDPRSPRASPRPTLPFAVPDTPTSSRIPSSPPLQNITNHPETYSPRSSPPERPRGESPERLFEDHRRQPQTNNESEQAYPTPSTNDDPPSSPRLRRANGHEDLRSSASSSSGFSPPDNMQVNGINVPTTSPTTTRQSGWRTVISPQTFPPSGQDPYFPMNSPLFERNPFTGRPIFHEDGIIEGLENRVLVLLERMNCPVRGYSLRTYLELIEVWAEIETRFLPQYVREFRESPQNHEDMRDIVSYVHHPAVSRELRQITGIETLRGFENLVDLPTRLRSVGRDSRGRRTFQMYPQGQGTRDEVIRAIENRIEDFLLAMSCPVRRQDTNTYLALFQQLLYMPEEELPMYALEYLSNRTNRAELTFFVQYFARHEIRAILRDLPGYQEIQRADSLTYNLCSRSPTPEVVGNAGNRSEDHYDA